MKCCQQGDSTLWARVRWHGLEFWAWNPGQCWAVFQPSGCARITWRPCIQITHTHTHIPSNAHCQDTLWGQKELLIAGVIGSLEPDKKHLLRPAVMRGSQPWRGSLFPCGNLGGCLGCGATDNWHHPEIRWGVSGVPVMPPGSSVPFLFGSVIVLDFLPLVTPSLWVSTASLLGDGHLKNYTNNNTCLFWKFL